PCSYSDAPCSASFFCFSVGKTLISFSNCFTLYVVFPGKAENAPEKFCTLFYDFPKQAPIFDAFHAFFLHPKYVFYESIQKCLVGFVIKGQIRVVYSEQDRPLKLFLLLKNLC